MALVVARRSTQAPMALGATPQAAAGEEIQAGAAASGGADPGWALAAYVLIIAAALAGWGLYETLDPTLAVAAGFSAFAPLYILAQAIERLLEPFTKHLGATTSEGQKVKKEQALAQRDLEFASLYTAAANPTSAASAQALVERIRKNTALIAWGIASALALLACGAFGIRLLHATGFDVPAVFDIAITGLAVGSGTKPLHDLISNIQKAKDTKADPAEATTSS